MSDPVTNAEVEDVLSSIRRLVSEDKRPRPAAAPAIAASDKLVLTPALRVADTGEARAEASDQASHEDPLTLDKAVLAVVREARQEPSHMSDAQDEPEGDTALAEDIWPVAQDDAADVDHQEDDRADAAEDAVAETSSRNSSWMDEDPEWRAKAEEAWQEAQADAARQLKEEHSGEPQQPVQESAAEEGGFSADDTAETASVEIEGAREADAEEDLPQTVHLQDENNSGAQPAPPYSDSQEAEPVTPDTEIINTDELADDLETDTIQADRVAGIGAKIAALEAATAQRRDEEWEADEPEAVAVSDAEPISMAWEDDVERDATGAPVTPEVIPDAEFQPVDETSSRSETADHQEAVEDQQFAASLSSDEQILDEESLRDLVSDIVRAELQGALGERITRNVRKLVRREIQRALASQDFD